MTSSNTTGARDQQVSGTGLHISGLHKEFRVGAKTVVALQDANLHTDQGTFLSLLGPSGCGKSTILRILAGLENPTSGTTRVDGKSPRELRKNNELGIAFQDHALLPWRSVYSNIKLPFEIAGKSVDKAYIDELIDLVGLRGFEKAKPAQLSGGMRQRVSIARSLVMKPSVLLLDEPFGALDALTRAGMHDLLDGLLAETGATTLLVTHDLDEALKLSDRVLLLAGGDLREDLRVPQARPRTRLSVEPLRAHLEARLH